MKRRSGSVVGPILIVVGLLMLLSQMGVPAFSHLWPLFLLALGVGLLIRYTQDRDESGPLFAGALLVLFGLFFQLDQLVTLHLGDHWPFFILAPGLALLVLAIVGSGKRDTLIPGFVLIAVAVVFYLFEWGFFHRLFKTVFDLVKFLVRFLLPVALIGGGVWMVLGRRRSLGERGRDFPEKFEPPFSRSPIPEDRPGDIDPSHHMASTDPIEEAETEDLPAEAIEEAEIEDLPPDPDEADEKPPR